ncbi:MAG: 50S ribosomal protein L9 [Candidatus Handelsmanbacteria bacterium]|nr:50S ribosomal protein L9 [Candidatus Handelsmanbacteria bacterium]
MKIVLLKDVERLGRAGEIVKVANGFARNFLIPRGEALLATDANIAHFESRRRQHEAAAEREKKAAESLARELEKTSLTVQVRVGEEDKLFGSVTSQNVADLLKEQGREIDRRKIELEEPIRALGVYTIEIRLHPEVRASIKLWVVKE